MDFGQSGGESMLFRRAGPITLSAIRTLPALQGTRTGVIGPKGQSDSQREIVERLGEFLAKGEHWKSVCRKSQGDIFPGIEWQNGGPTWTCTWRPSLGSRITPD
jgi:hypothetical protein